MDLLWSLKVMPAALIGLTVHEFSHAYVAYRLGDTTAKDAGRLTLNPLKHLDPIGFILIIVAGFGWAKPVTFRSENLSHKHRDEILIAVAGPASNAVLGIILCVLARVLYLLPPVAHSYYGVSLVNLTLLWGIINFGLFVFNLIPIPPLDGSHLYLTYMQELNPALTQKLYRIGTWALLLIILLQNRLHTSILPVNRIVNSITNAVLSLLNF